MKSKLVLIALLFGTLAFAQTNSDKTIFSQYKKTIQRKQPIGQLIVASGEYFQNKPYVASTLEGNAKESLVVNLREFDCTTFVESVLALSKTAQSTDFSFQHFCKQLETIRYRKGIIVDYTSRLHYFSDWIYDNQSKGIITDVTQQIGGDSIRFQVGFMSTHPDKYKALKENPSFVPTIALQESVINSRLYYYIPKHKIGEVAAKIEDGDIIAIVTNIKGLEISHLGIAVHKSGVLKLLNASSRTNVNKVVISDNSLEEYAQNNKTTTGIIVLRVN